MTNMPNMKPEKLHRWPMAPIQSVTVCITITRGGRRVAGCCRRMVRDGRGRWRCSGTIDGFGRLLLYARLRREPLMGCFEFVGKVRCQAGRGAFCVDAVRGPFRATGDVRIGGCLVDLQFSEGREEGQAATEPAC